MELAAVLEGQLKGALSGAEECMGQGRQETEENGGVHAQGYPSRFVALPGVVADKSADEDLTNVVSG